MKNSIPFPMPGWAECHVPAPRSERPYNALAFQTEGCEPSPIQTPMAGLAAAEIAVSREQARLERAFR